MKKHSPLTYLYHMARGFLDIDPALVARVISGSPRAYGIDISSWEDTFNPDQAAPNLIDFAIFKATEGITWIDDRFVSFYQASVGKVPIIGAYHYLRSGMSARTQADHFTNVVGAKKIDILVCDFESTNNQMDDAFVAVAQEFGSFVNLWKPNCKLLFYTNPSTYDNVVYPGSIRMFGEDIFTKYPWGGLWIAQYYYSPSPDKNPSMPKNRGDWVLWQYSEAGDPDLHGTGGWCDQNVFNGDVNALTSWIGGGSIPSQPDSYIVKRPRAEYGFYITPGTGEMPLLDAIEASNQNGWEAAMNGGAGFEYTDATHAIPKTTGFQSILDDAGNPAYYARRMIADGMINLNLDTVYVAPWCVLGFDVEFIYLIVTRGLEGGEGMTQMEAAEYVKGLGIVNAYLMDSGHSAQIQENGVMLYWPYGPSEKVPQHIGLKKKENNMTKTHFVSNPEGAQYFKDVAQGKKLGKLAYGTHVEVIGTVSPYFRVTNEWKLDEGNTVRILQGDLSLISTTPPPDESKPPKSVVVTLPDGSIWEATQFTRVG